MKAVKLFGALAALVVTSLSVGAPAAAAQQGDRCAELHAVLADTATPADDPAEQPARTAINNAVRAGYDALQCGGAMPVAGPIELNRQYMSAGYRSHCPVVGPPPAPPTGRLTTRQFNDAVPAFNTWAETNNAALSCRAAEARQLHQQLVIASAVVAVRNWRTKQQAEEAAAAFGRANPRS